MNMSVGYLKIGEIQYMGSEQNSKNGYTPLTTTKTQRIEKKSQTGSGLVTLIQPVNIKHIIHQGGESNG
jgi:hypothetical protein